MNEETLFHEALARSSPGERDQFLDEACAGRPELRAAVDGLLAAHAESGEFLARPAPPSADTVHRDGTTDPEHQAPEAAPAPLPARIGRYEIRKLLGRGGMGAVYLAHDPQLDRLVALKVPKLSGPGAEERFLREARAAAAVSHPNLCPVHDAGRGDGVLYLAMGYIPGCTLTELLREEGRLAPARAARLAAAIAQAMAEAHRHGIVHRDLKPGNVLLNPHGEPVVTDFGLALRDPPSAPEGENATADFAPRLTQAGIMVGTPTYMPPEQACGDLARIGPASDVYSLGVILYELLTGQPPFGAETIAQLVRMIVAEPAPPPSRIQPDIPAALDAVCARALAKDPAERFASMEEFAAALTETAAGRKRRLGRYVAALTAVVVLFAVAAGVFYVQTDHGTIEVRLSDPAAKVQVLVDGDVIQLTDDNRVTRIRSGPHALLVQGPDFETETRKFKVMRGKTTVVEVELRPRPKAPDPSPPVDRQRLAGLLAQGRRLVRQGKYKELADIADDALKIDTESPGALALRATVREARKDFIGARADVEAALRLNPETFQALVVRTGLYARAGKIDDAIADATAASRLDPTNPIPWEARGLNYFRKQECAQAIADVTQSVKLGNRRVDPWLTRGAAHAGLGEYDQAVAAYTRAAAIRPDDWRVFFQRSAVHAKAGHAEQAAADWALARKLNPAIPDNQRATFPEPPRPPERRKLDDSQRAEFDRVMKAAEAAWRSRQFAKCEKAVEQACDIDPTAAAARSLRARLWGQQGQYEKSVAEASEAIRLDPQDAWAHTARGSSRNTLKDHAGAIADHTTALRLDPGSHSIWNNRALAYLSRGQPHQALADVAEALRLRPNYSLAVQNRGACWLQLGDYPKALADYLIVIDAQPSNAHLRRICAAIYARLGKFEDADKQRQLASSLKPELKDAQDMELPVPLPAAKQDPELPVESPPANTDRTRLAELLASGRQLIRNSQMPDVGTVADQALAIDPESPGALALRASFRLAVQRDPIGARADADRALKLNPETYWALYARGIIFENTGKRDDAIAEFTMALRLDPSDPHAWSQRANAYGGKGEFRQAVADATRAVELGIDWTGYTNRGMGHACLGEYTKALADYDIAARKSPGNPRVFSQRSAVYARMGNAEKAAADWATAQKLDPTLRLQQRRAIPDPPKAPERKKLSPEQDSALAAALNRGEAALLAQQLGDGRKAAEVACRIDPTSARAHALLGRMLVHMKLYDQALVQAEEAIRLDPDHAWAYTTRGGVRSGRKDYAGAIADHTVALRLDPTLPSVWYNRGTSYLRRGQYHQALSDFSEALRLRPEFDQAYASRGACCLHLGDYDKALADYTKAAELEPTNPRWRMICAAVCKKLGRLDEAQAQRALATKLDGSLRDAPDMPLPATLPSVKQDPELRNETRPLPPAVDG
jgi:tetratricopeptide (TPR) repeat protein